MLHVISEGLTSGDEATFLKVDTALVKTHHCWMVKEPSACLPPRSPARKCCLIAFQNPCSQTNGKFRVPRQWQCPLHAASLLPQWSRERTSSPPCFLAPLENSEGLTIGRRARSRGRAGGNASFPRSPPQPAFFLYVTCTAPSQFEFEIPGVQATSSYFCYQNSTIPIILLSNQKDKAS